MGSGRSAGQRRRLRGALLTGACLLTLPVAGCGDGNVEELANGFRAAIHEAKPQTEVRGGVHVEAETESAAKETVCRALTTYGSNEAESLTDQIRQYADKQRVLARFSLNDIDPAEADRLANAASDVDDTQKAADVAEKLGC